MKIRRDIGVSALLGLSFGAVAWGQAVSTAQINGTVQDASGSAVPGAAITVTRTDKGALKPPTSGADGSYTVPSLPVGRYSLEVEKAGFATYVQTGVVLQVASNPAIPVTLTIGAVSEHVQVEANAAMVETQSTGVGQVIDSRRVLDLPLVGRQVTDLVVLSGAAVNLGTTTTNNRGVYPNVSSFSVAGGLGGGNIFALDGAFHNDVYALSALPLPFPDALQEFKVETSSLPAQYGYHSGGAINAVTKSGSNEWHGGAFEFLRNYDLNARNFFATSRDGLKRNQFGGTFGGPIRKNRLFFFAAYQETDTRQTPSDTLAFVPTAQMLAGDFSIYASSACQSKPLALKNPSTGQAYTDNQIPSSQISPVALALSKHLPPPANVCGQTNFGIPTSSDEHFSVGKVDYQLNPAHSMFWRYLGTQYSQLNPYAVSKNVLSTTTPGASDLVQSITFGDTYLFGATVVNSFRATYNRVANAKIASQFFSAQDVGINIYQYTDALPKYTSLAITGGFSLGGTTGGHSTYATVSAQLGDDVLVTRGNHQMAFGANLIAWQSNSNANTYTSGVFSITGTATGSGLADFVSGQITSLTQGGPNKTYPEQWYLGLYAQDAWKLRRGLTLTYGVRWEPEFPPQLGQNIMTHFDLNGFLQGVTSKVYVNAPPGLYFPGDPLFGPNGSSSINKRWNQFAPRAGIVWDPTGNGSTVIRAGYGIFYDQNSAELFIQTGMGPPFGGKVVVNSPAGGLANPYSGFAGGNPFPFALSSTTPFAPGGTYNTFNPDTRWPYVQQWNFGIQKQLGKDWLVSASYIGNEVTHLYGQRELNPAVYLGTQPCSLAGASYAVCSTTTNTNQRRVLSLLNPTAGAAYGFVDVWDDGGTRSYNGLLVSTQKRLSRGFTFTANYSWSHCIGNPINTFPNVGTNDYFAATRAGDRGDCTSSSSDVSGTGTDHRHIANITALGAMPDFSGKALRMIAGDWKGSATLSMYSGDALTVVTGLDNALNGINSATQYANQILPDVYGNKTTDSLIGTGARSQWLNPAAFAPPAPGALGNMAPGTVRGPGILLFNAGLSRLFRVKEKHTMEFRVEAQNVLNHTNFANPTAVLNSNTFGRITSTASGNAGNARIIQFAIKYSF
jgi:hypothetical protein